MLQAAEHDIRTNCARLSECILNAAFSLDNGEKAIFTCPAQCERFLSGKIKLQAEQSKLQEVHHDLRLHQ